MPIYEYRCSNCGKVVEMLRPYEDMNKTIFCLECAKPTREVFHDLTQVNLSPMHLIISKSTPLWWDGLAIQSRIDQAPESANRRKLQQDRFDAETTRRTVAGQKQANDKARYMDQGWKKKTFYPSTGGA